MSSVGVDQGRIEAVRANPDAARGTLERALLAEPETAVTTLGYATYQRTLQKYADWLETSGDRQAASTREPSAATCRRRPAESGHGRRMG
jgi:hypothetical protein